MSDCNLVGYDPEDDDETEDYDFPVEPGEILADTFMRQIEAMQAEGYPDTDIIFGLTYATTDLSASIIAERNNEMGSEIAEYD